MARNIQVYYDGWCPMCNAIRSRIERLDWLNQVSFRSIREPGVMEELGVSAERLEQRMHVRHSGSGQVEDGIYAVAAIAARVPLFMPLWPFVRLAAAVGLGQPLYDFIASRRAIVPVGHCNNGICEIHHPTGE